MYVYENLYKNCIINITIADLDNNIVTLLVSFSNLRFLQFFILNTQLTAFKEI